jgi:hypothetical protein
MIHRSNGHGRRADSGSSLHALAQGLGWFSIGLGLAEVLAPRQLARSLGMDEHTRLIGAYGVREIATGIAILTQRDPTPWIWGRVAGDALDLATLATGLDRRNPERGNVGLAIAAVAGVTVLDVICAQGLSTQRRQQEHRVSLPDYSDRSGFPRPPEAMRGVARDFEVPRDMRTPELLRPYRVV